MGACSTHARGSLNGMLGKLTPMENSGMCAFCGVVAGRVEASVLYEDPDTMAFVDLRQPAWPRGGHVLVVPKTHVEFLYDLPGDLAARLMQAAVRVARAVQQVAEPGGISLWSSNGAAADQEVPHVHLHVLARYHDDGLLRVYRDRPERPQRASLDELAAKVRAAFSEA